MPAHARPAPARFLAASPLQLSSLAPLVDRLLTRLQRALVQRRRADVAEAVRREAHRCTVQLREPLPLELVSNHHDAGGVVAYRRGGREGRRRVGRERAGRVAGWAGEGLEEGQQADSCVWSTWSCITALTRHHAPPTDFPRLEAGGRRAGTLVLAVAVAVQGLAGPEVT